MPDAFRHTHGTNFEVSMLPRWFLVWEKGVLASIVGGHKDKRQENRIHNRLGTKVSILLLFCTSE